METVACNFEGCTCQLKNQTIIISYGTRPVAENGALKPAVCIARLLGRELSRCGCTFMNMALISPL